MDEILNIAAKFTGEIITAVVVGVLAAIYRKIEIKLMKRKDDQNSYFKK